MHMQKAKKLIERKINRGKQIQEEAQGDKAERGQGRVETFQKVRSPGRRILHTPGIINITTGNNYEVLTKEQGEIQKQGRRGLEQQTRYSRNGQLGEEGLHISNG